MSSAKLWKTKILQIAQSLLIFILITGWIFSGWPQIFNFPPKIQVAQAVDITVDTGDTAPIAGHNAPRSLVWTSASDGYFFYIDSDNDFKYAKTIDGGQNWTAAVAEIDTDTTITALAFDVWYDKWTPGDSGTKIHIWWAEIDLDDINYRALDTSNDSFGNKIQVFAGATGVSARANFVSGTKARGGNLYAVGTIDAAAECEFARSTDGGATWDATRASPQEVCGDQGMLFPGNETDTQDIWMLYDDIDANALTLKTNDDSANSWSESSAIATVVENTTLGTGEYPFYASIRQSDGHLIAATHSALDLSTTDFQIWDINGAASITEKTAITTNIDDNYYSSVFIDQNTDDIYVSYAGKRDGSETLGTTVGIYYTKSTDGGTSWTAGDTAYSESTGNYRQNWAGMMGNRFGVVWRNDATEGLLFNYVNSLDLTPVSLTFTVDTGSVSFVSAVTPGTPVSTSSVLTVNTNNAAGYNITINRASTTPTLFIFVDNATTTVADTPSGNNWTAPAATTTAGPSAIWTSGTTKGLGFRVKQTGTVSNIYSTAWWGTSDAAANALYSGISTSTPFSAQKIADTTLGSGTNENTTMEYRIDVDLNQRSGTYISSPVTYTATVNL